MVVVLVLDSVFLVCIFRIKLAVLAREFDLLYLQPSNP